MLRVGPKSFAMNHIFNVLDLGHILDTRSSHAMQNPSALRLYRHAKIDPMMCKLIGPGDDHGGILLWHEKSVSKMENKEKKKLHQSELVAPIRVASYISNIKYKIAARRTGHGR